MSRLTACLHVTSERALLYTSLTYSLSIIPTRFHRHTYISRNVTVRVRVCIQRGSDGLRVGALTRDSPLCHPTVSHAWAHVLCVMKAHRMVYAYILYILHNEDEQFTRDTQFMDELYEYELAMLLWYTHAHPHTHPHKQTYAHTGSLVTGRSLIVRLTCRSKTISCATRTHPLATRHPPPTDAQRILSQPRKASKHQWLCMSTISSMALNRSRQVKVHLIVCRPLHDALTCVSSTHACK